MLAEEASRHTGGTTISRLRWRATPAKEERNRAGSSAPQEHRTPTTYRGFAAAQASDFVSKCTPTLVGHRGGLGVEAILCPHQVSARRYAPNTEPPSASTSEGGSLGEDVNERLLVVIRIGDDQPTDLYDRGVGDLLAEGAVSTVARWAVR